MRNEKTRYLVEVALVIALAAVLNSLKIWRMPQGGTLSFVMLPIIVLAFRRGPLTAILAGALYGVIDFFVDPQPPVHWVQPLLDYPVAYAAVGLAGLAAATWRRAQLNGARTAAAVAIIAGTLVAVLGRYVVHTTSGAIFFAEYAPPGQPALLYSAIYNLYVPLSGALAGAAALVVLPAVERASASIPTAEQTAGDQIAVSGIDTNRPSS